MPESNVSPYLQRRLRDLEEVRRRQASRQVLDVVVGEALGEAKASGQGLVGQLDLATRAALRLRPDMDTLDALDVVERIRRRGCF